MAKYGWLTFVNFMLAFLCVQRIKVSAQLTDFERNYSRNVSDTVVNPQCRNDSRCTAPYTNGLLAYTTATGVADEIHHLFSTIGAPTLMMTRTKLDSNINVNYTSLFDGMPLSVNFSDPLAHSFGIIFSHLYEFDDKKDTANLTDYQNDTASNYVYDLDELAWIVDSYSNSGDYYEMVLNATNSTSQNSSSLFKNGGYISFRLRYDKKDGRLDSRPHMEHTANSTMITVVMANLTTRFGSPRLALEMTMFSKGDVADDNYSSTSIDRSLDDEFSPGVFQMYNWVANTSKPREDAWGYAQWKPVTYTLPERINDNINHAWTYPNIPENRKQLLSDRLPAHGLVHCFFPADFSGVSFNATNVSFGTVGDKFYTNTKYVVWTLSAGLGPVPSDGVSTLVVLVIAIGLGIPLLLMILSSVYVCVKNQRKNSGYTSINS